MTNDVDQDAIITLEFQNSRQLPPKCSQEFHQYNIFLTDNGVALPNVSVYDTLGYGYFQIEGGLKAAHKYEIMIYDFAGEGPNDFTLSLYSAKTLLKWTETPPI